MPNNTGTLIAAPIRPISSDDTFPTAYANEILGGHHQTATLTARDAIPAERRAEGMLCTVVETGRTYRLAAGLNTWTDTLAETDAAVTALSGQADTAAAAITVLQLGQTNGHIGFATLAALNADLNHPAGTLAEVVRDATAAYNGTYIKTGGSGTGSWDKSTVDVSGRVSALEVSSVEKTMLFDITNHNLLNPANIDFTRRYSTGQNKIINDDGSLIAWSGFVPVTPGTTYVFSGSTLVSFQGGYYAAANTAATGITNITFSNTSPANNNARKFTVPSGINFVALNMPKTAGGALTGTVQLEVGEVATAYQPYAVDYQVKDSLLPPIPDFDPDDYVSKAELIVELSHNMINPAVIDYIKRYSVVSKTMVTDAEGIAATERIPVVEGEFYVCSGAGQYILPPQGGYFTSAVAATAVANVTWLTPPSGDGQGFQVPTGLGITHVVINLRKLGGIPSGTSLAGNVQLEIGQVATAYQAYELVPKIKTELLTDLSGFSADDYIPKSELIVKISHNLIDPAGINYTKRYSVASKTLVTDSEGIAATARIPVTEGLIYTVSGDGRLTISGGQGGYFSSLTVTTAVANITWFAPPAGVGASFLVPSGLGITHVVVSLRKLGDNPSATSLAGTVQMEVGELVTAYQPYSPMDYINPSLIFSTPTDETTAVLSDEAWYKYITADSGESLGYKIPLFRQHWLRRDKNLCVVNTGTSITARSTEHCTPHANATTRPPLMHSNNLASLLWDRMQWDLQQYRRYDAAGFFTESGGTFATDYALAEWDDGPYRNGLTRYSGTTGAAVAFTVPVGAWQFNFIYRSDSTGVVTNTVTIAEGSGKMEAWNGSAWVEAHGYVFSMREAAPVARSISVPNPSTGGSSSLTIASKGNTTYQKRLKMRCKSGAIDSRAATKTVSVTGSSAGRFMFWGVEWSPREWMITFINAARGSHNSQAGSASGLPRFADNEVWGFAPDLVLAELLHNDGAAAASNQAAGIFERLTNDWIFRADYELSMVTRAAFYGLTPEFGLYTSTIAYGFSGIEEDGTLKIGPQGDGTMMTALDKYSQAVAWVEDNKPNTAILHTSQGWVDAARAIFAGNLKTATEASNKSGPSFTNDGGHPNDTGSKILAKRLLPLFNFVH